MLIAMAPCVPRPSASWSSLFKMSNLNVQDQCCYCPAHLIKYAHGIAVFCFVVNIKRNSMIPNINMQDVVLYMYNGTRVCQRYVRWSEWSGSSSGTMQNTQGNACFFKAAMANNFKHVFFFFFFWLANIIQHDNVIKWKHFPRYWPFVRGIRRSPVNSPHKGQWCGALIFSLICTWINGWVNNHEAGDLRRHPVHYDVIVMKWLDFFSMNLMAHQILIIQTGITHICV